MSKVLVCRCEDVTLHELEAALGAGHRDVESIKRYTGFGTGWCQGKWCLALCSRLITARGGEVGQPITPRPPYHPLTLASLAGLEPAGEGDEGDERGPRDERG
jgi:bacterioferritin-associated ferredoxin